MTWVYRIEDRWGRGPYNRGSSQIKWSERRTHCDSTGHLSPSTEGWNPEMNEDRIYGFSTLEQVGKWFTFEELFCLYGLGFKIKKVKAEKVSRGETQVLFKRVRGEKAIEI